MGNKPTKVPTPSAPPTDPRFGTTEFGTSGRARAAGFNLETQRRAEQAAKNKEIIERMRRSGIILQDSPVLKMGPLTSTDTGLLVPPQALEREVKPLTRGQRLKEGLKSIPIMFASLKYSLHIINDPPLVTPISTSVIFFSLYFFFFFFISFNFFHIYFKFFIFLLDFFKFL